MGQPTTIECALNGPYLVKNLGEFRDAQGEPIKGPPVLALCRCGGSANKPFCDGSHKKNGFSGVRVADGSADKCETYAAAGITIHDNRSVCAHAGHCTDGLAEVFKYKCEPWIDAKAGTVENIIGTIRTCPSGALSYTLGDVTGADPQRQPAITVTKDGPYAVVGGPELMAQTFAKGVSKEHFTLCRCGASKNKPFCDGAHWSVGFKG